MVQVWKCCESASAMVLIRYWYHVVSKLRGTCPIPASGQSPRYAGLASSSLAALGTLSFS